MPIAIMTTGTISGESTSALTSERPVEPAAAQPERGKRPEHGGEQRGQRRDLEAVDDPGRPLPIGRPSSDTTGA